MTQYILTLSCDDKPGIVAAVTGFLFNANMNIAESNQFGDPDTGRFFMRVGFTSTDKNGDLESLHSDFTAIAEPFGMQWQIHDIFEKTRAIVMVSKFDHCLVDLLYRCRTDMLKMDIVAVVSNHEMTRHLVEREGIPFYYRPVTADTKAAAEAELETLIGEHDGNLIILARYMQILSEDFADRHAGQIINIHHSFLPSFKGSVPYSQAYNRGVKMIGATAHYVTASLDEGPIISQHVAPVRHDMTVNDLVKTGHEIEQSVLARAVAAHTEHRILLNKQKTVVFD
jgi:formyltetrahydrofolate deformylase